MAGEKLQLSGLQEQEDTDVELASRIWIIEVVDNIVLFLPPNDVACTIRLVNRVTAARFGHHVRVQLSHPSPPEEFRRRWGVPGAMQSLTLRQRRQLLCLTAASGSLANLEIAVESAGCILPADLLDAAAVAGQLHACKWLRQRGWPWGSALAKAAQAGRQAICAWLLAVGCPLDGTAGRGIDAVSAAARGGHVDLMDWLLMHSRDAETYVFAGGKLLTAGAEGCDLETLQRLYYTWLEGRELSKPPPFHQNMLAAAAGSPTSDWQAKVEWLEGLGYPRTSVGTCKTAAVRPYASDRLAWLRQRGYPADASVAESAACAGNLAALEFLLAAGIQLDSSRAARGAAAGGHLAVLQALHARGCPINPQFTVYAAAAEGHLEVVAWAVETLAFDVRSHGGDLQIAARSGSIQLLSWLHEFGVQWNEVAFCEATVAGSGELLEWLVECGCPMGNDGQPYVKAAANADLATLRCLVRLGCPWGPAGRTLTECIRNGSPLAVLRWLVEAGCPVDWGEEAEFADGWCGADVDGVVRAWLAEERQGRRTG